jgi:hypothetical protein
MLTTHGEPDQTSLRVFGSTGATLLAPRGAQARPHCFLRVSNCLFPLWWIATVCTKGYCAIFLWNKSRWTEQRMALGCWPLRRNLQVPKHRHGGLDQ